MNNHFNISLYFLKGAAFTQIGTINGHWLVKVLTHPPSLYELFVAHLKKYSVACLCITLIIFVLYSDK